MFACKSHIYSVLAPPLANYYRIRHVYHFAENDSSPWRPKNLSQILLQMPINMLVSAQMLLVVVHEPINRFQGPGPPRSPSNISILGMLLT
jgi:hypothetical protein